MIAMDWSTILLTCLTTLLGGCNIFQLFQLRSERRKGSAQALQEEVKGLQMIIEIQRSEISRLQQRQQELETTCAEMRARLDKIVK